MRRLCLLPLAVALAPGAQSLSHNGRDAPAVVGFDIQRRKIGDIPGSDLLQPRDSGKTVGESVYNEKSFYFCNVTIGTPGQELGLVLDTGSADLWCNVAGSRLCEHFPEDCRITGAFDPHRSSSFSFVNSFFHISYADGTGAAGDYVSDKIGFGGATIDNFQFALGYQSDSPVGVLGIGYPSNEAIVTRFGRTPYANLPKAMLNAGWIKADAYSLWLNDLDANTGTILFGGVDTEKFHGDLQTLPVEKVNGNYRQFIIALTGVSFSFGSHHRSYSSNALPVGALLDSGSTVTYLPNPIVQDIYNDLRVTYDPSSGNAFVPCSRAHDDVKITYTFSSPSITVSINELVINAGKAFFRDGTRACLFGILPAGRSTVVLGDTFLRSAYVVYDLANNQISLAQTRFNSPNSNIVEIGTGVDSVPSATRVPNPATSVPIAGVGARIGGIGRPSGSVTPLPQASADAATLAAAPGTTGYWVIGLLWCLLGI